MKGREQLQHRDGLARQKKQQVCCALQKAAGELRGNLRLLCKARGLGQVGGISELNSSYRVMRIWVGSFVGSATSHFLHKSSFVSPSHTPTPHVLHHPSYSYKPNGPPASQIPATLGATRVWHCTSFLQCSSLPFCHHGRTQT